MVLRRPLIALSLVAALLVTLAVAVRMVPSVPATRPPASVAEATPLPSQMPAGLAGDISPTYDGPTYDPAVARAPTRDKPQSKLWYHDGLWWGTLFDDQRDAFTIWWLDLATHEWVNTHVLVDDRPWTRQDVLWDGEALVTASHGMDETSARQALQIRRFSYDAAERRWVGEPNFPVTVTDGGLVAASLARDGIGRLWTTFITGAEVSVAVAELGDLQWSQVFPLPVEHGSVAVDQAAIVSVGDDVGVIWSNQVDDGVYFALHRAGAPPDAWVGPEVALEGLDAADDHISVRSLDGPDGATVYAVVKTSLDEAEPPNPLAPQVLMLARTPDGEWSSHAFGRVEDHHTRPILVLDDETRQAYVFATSPFDGGQIYMKQTPLDRISFPVGLGTPIVTGRGEPKINNATATRQMVDSASGLVVLAADDSTGQYQFAELGVPESTGIRPSVEVVTPLITMTFDGLAPGLDLARQRYHVTPEGMAEAVVAPWGDAVVGRVTSLDGAPVRLCHRFPAISRGIVTMQTRLMITAAAQGDAPLTAFRGSGEEITGLRILDSARWAYRVGEDREVTEVPWEPERWYDITIHADLGSRTYEVTVTDESGAQMLGLADLPWQALPPGLDEVCFQSPRGAAGMSLLIDRLAVMARS